jgi:hypothetical protein
MAATQSADGRSRRLPARKAGIFNRGVRFSLQPLYAAEKLFYNVRTCTLLS